MYKNDDHQDQINDQDLSFNPCFNGTMYKN